MSQNSVHRRGQFVRYTAIASVAVLHLAATILTFVAVLSIALERADNHRELAIAGFEPALNALLLVLSMPLLLPLVWLARHLIGSNAPNWLLVIVAALNSMVVGWAMVRLGTWLRRVIRHRVGRESPQDN